MGIPLLYDRIQETSVTTGRGTLTLVNSIVTHLPFSTIGNNHSCHYLISDLLGNWESGMGMVYEETLSRDIVLTSSDSNAKVSFPEGLKNVWLDMPAAALEGIGLNVRQWGAKGDGETDDSAAFTAAISATAGQHLIVPAGTYLLDGVDATSDVSLLLHQGAVLKHKANAAYYLFCATGAHTVRVQGGTIDGNRANQSNRVYALAGDGAAGAVWDIHNVRFTGTKGAAIYMDHFACQLDVFDCEFLDMAEHSLTDAGGWTTAIYLWEAAQDAAPGAVRVSRSRFIHGTAATPGASPGGIFMGADNGSCISVDGCFFDGIGQNYGNNAICSVHSHGSGAVDPMVNGFSVTNCTFLNWSLSAIQTKCASNIIIRGNTIRNGQSHSLMDAAICAYMGYFAESKQYRAIISDNIIDDTGVNTGTNLKNDGIRVEGASHRATNVKVTGNQFTKCGQNIVFSGVDDFQVSGNTIVGSTDGTTGLEHGIVVIDCQGKVIIDANDITVTNGHGIVAQSYVNTATFAILNNTIDHSNNVYGVTIRGARRIIGRSNTFIGSNASPPWYFTRDSAETPNNIGLVAWDASNLVIGSTPGSIRWDYVTEKESTGLVAVNGGLTVLDTHDTNVSNSDGLNVIAGYSGNAIGTDSGRSVIAGGGSVGAGNSIGNTSYLGTISGGFANTIGATSIEATISGGGYNAVSAHAPYSTISGGSENVTGNGTDGFGHWASVGGGFHNAVASYYGRVGGGRNNSITVGSDGHIGGGYLNVLTASYDAIGGGRENSISADYGAIAGGRLNSVTVAYGTVAGGYSNTAGSSAFVGGGANNSALGVYATVIGGDSNNASGNWALASGHRAKAAAQGAVALSDSQDADFTVDTINAFGARFAGGFAWIGGNVGIGGFAPGGSSTVGTNALWLLDGTPPVGGSANHSALYSASGELYAFDSSGNATKISPHNAEGKWEYFSRHTGTGRTVRVNMERLVRLVEKLSGEKLVFVGQES